MGGRIANLNFYKSWGKKYMNMPSTVKASLLFAFCGFLQKGIAFIVVPIYTRIMPSEDYGKYSVFFSWYQLIMIFTTLNMWNYLINNGMTEFAEKRKEFIASLQGLAGLLTLAWIFIYLPLSGAWEHATGLSLPMMLIMFVELITMPSYEYWCAVKRYNYDAKGIVVTSILISFFTPIIGVPLILFSTDKGFAAILAKCGVPIVIYSLVAVSMLRDNHKLYNKQFWLYALRFNLPLVPHFLSVMLLQSSDRIMIERICGATDAAIYSVAYSASLALAVFNSAILNSFIPYTYKSIKNSEYKKVGEKAIPLVMFIGMANFTLAVLAPELITILAPEEYHSAVYVIPPVVMSNLFMFLFNLFANIEYYYKETKMVAMASMASAVCNIVLNYIFINKFGFIAAAYTTVVCYAIFSICHFCFMRRVENKYMNGAKVYDNRKMLIISTLFVVFAIMVSCLYDQKFNIVRYVLVICIGILAWTQRRYIVSFIKYETEKVDTASDQQQG